MAKKTTTPKKSTTKTSLVKRVVDKIKKSTKPVVLSENKPKIDLESALLSINGTSINMENLLKIGFNKSDIPLVTQTNTFGKVSLYHYISNSFQIIK